VFGYIVTFTKLFIIYHTSIYSPPPSFSFILPPPVPRTFSTGLSFPFTYMCVQYLYYIHLPTPFPHIHFPSRWYQSPRQDLFSLLFSVFVKKNKRETFLFVWEIQGEFPVVFHVLQPNWFISFIFLLSTLLPFLW
jgi:hypothetical protein